jgi:hypothetical protein
LQQKEEPKKEARPKADLPQDTSLKEAVVRMTEAAKAEERDKLIMTPAQWQKLVLSYMQSNRVAEFGKEIVNRVGKVSSIDEINKWLGLGMNIWNNTPQPDRGGKSAFEIRRDYDFTSGA